MRSQSSRSDLGERATAQGWGCPFGVTSARPSVSRVLSRRLAPSRMAIHLGPPVARQLMRPTRGLGSAPLPRRVAPHGLRPPIWPCSGWSLPRFTPPSARAAGGIVTVALVLVSRRTGVTRHPALRSSDFPHAVHGVAPDVARGHPTASLTGGV